MVDVARFGARVADGRPDRELVMTIMMVLFTGLGLALAVAMGLFPIVGWSLLGLATLNWRTEHPMLTESL